MTTLAEPAYFELPATASYRRRRCGWFAAPGHPDGRCGTLRLVVEPAGRSADAVRVCEYAVWCDQDHPAADGVRSFVVAKDDGTVYRCRVGPDWSDCTCPAGTAGAPCKHAAAIGKLARRGVL